MKNNSLKFFTNNNLRDKQIAANNLFKRKYDVMGNIPVYKEIPINDSLLRNTNSLYEAIIEGSNRIINNISSINTEMRIFGNFDNYLQIRQRVDGKVISDSGKYYNELNKKKNNYLNEIDINNKKIKDIGDKYQLTNELQIEEEYQQDKDLEELERKYQNHIAQHNTKQNTINANNTRLQIEEIRLSELKKLIITNENKKKEFEEQIKNLNSTLSDINNNNELDYVIKSISIDTLNYEINNIQKDLNKIIDNLIIYNELYIKGRANYVKDFYGYKMDNSDFNKKKKEYEIEIENKKSNINKLKTSLNKSNKIKQKLEEIENVSQQLNEVSNLNIHNNILLENFEKFNRVANSIESGELDQNIDLIQIDSFLDTNKTDPEHYTLINRRNNGKFPIVESGYKINKTLTNPIINNVIDKLSKSLTNIKMLNNLITKLQNKYILVQQKNAIFDSLKEIQNEIEKLNLYDFVMKRVSELLADSNKSKIILVDFHTKFKYCIKTINSDMSKVAENWSNYERNYNQKF